MVPAEQHQPYVTPARRALAVLGDSWTILILRYAFRGARRYSEWRERMRIPDLVLTDRLKRLVSYQVLEKRAGRDSRHQEYWLTERGLELYALLIAIWDWESAHVPPGRRHYATLTHTACGQVARPVLTCAHCGEKVGPRDTRVLAPPDTGTYADTSADLPNYRQSSVSWRGQGEEWMGWQTIQIIGDRWSNGLLGALFLGRHGFDEFERDLGIPPAILSNRLAKFVKLGIVRREAHATNARRRFYRLTDKGLALYPITIQFVAWGDRWLNDRPGAYRVIHLGCGHAFRPVLSCSACAAPLRRQEIRLA